MVTLSLASLFCSDYEMRRQKNILDNQSLLQDLGLLDAIRKRAPIQEVQLKFILMRRLATKILCNLENTNDVCIIKIEMSIGNSYKYGGKKLRANHYKAKVKEINLEKRVSRRLLGQAPEDVVSKIYSLPLCCTIANCNG